LELASPADGEQVFESVMRREEAFSGAWSDKLPDLVMVPQATNTFTMSDRATATLLLQPTRPLARISRWDIFGVGSRYPKRLGFRKEPRSS
jgi:hypothetical protein